MVDIFSEGRGNGLIVSDCSKPPSNELCNLVQRTIKYLCHSFRSGAGGLRTEEGKRFNISNNVENAENAPGRWTQRGVGVVRTGLAASE